MSIKHDMIKDLLRTLSNTVTVLLGVVDENTYRTAWVGLFSPRLLASLLSSYDDEYGEII